MGDHGLNPSQFMLGWILYEDKREHQGEPLPEEGKAMANIYRYKEMIGPWKDRDINDMIKRGYLVNRGDTKKIYPDQLEVTDKFVDAVFASISDFQEFVDTYPDFTDHFDDPRKGQIPLKAVDMDKVESIFNSKVKSKVEYQRLMKSLKWAKEKGKIRMNILNYVSGEIWKAHLKKMREDAPDTERTIIN